MRLLLDVRTEIIQERPYTGKHKSAGSSQERLRRLPDKTSDIFVYCLTKETKTVRPWRPEKARESHAQHRRNKQI